MAQTEVAGPYWVHTTAANVHQVRGANGKIIREYSPDQAGLANADCRRLQKGDRERRERIRNAAQDLLAALEGAVGALEFSRDYHNDLGNAEQAFAQDKLDAARAAIAKALGQ